MRPIHIFLILSAVALLAGLYKAFEKAGQKGWKALIPVYNFVIWLRIIQKPWWWIFLVMIPTVGFYMLAVMIVLLSNCFGKRKFSQHVFAVIGYFIWLPYLGFSKKIKWNGVPAPEKKRHWSKEWGEAGIFAVIAATLIRTFFFEAFVIPSSSMESTLMVGDYLFVSKMSYGAKIPAIPLTVPFTHNTLPMTETTPSYLDWIELPYMRLPGFGSVERNDIVVFNFPEGDTVWTGDRNQSYYGRLRTIAADSGLTTDEVRKHLIPDQITTNPVDKEDNYVKRCVGLPGDVIEIKDKTLYVNGTAAYVAEGAQWAYDFLAPANSAHPYEDLQEEFWSKGITDDHDFAHYVQDSVTPEGNRIPKAIQGSIPVHKSNLKIFARLVSQYQPSLMQKGVLEYASAVFPHDTVNFKWNRDNFGPMTLPKKGVTVPLKKETIALYDRLIKVYEGNTLEEKDGKFILNGQPATSYTFKQDYYWMMGDNRHNSLDSRYWGYVPADHIVGKPVFVWLSKGDWSGWRPDRMMSFVSKEGLSKSYLWWVIFGIAGIWAFSYFRNRNKPKDDGKKTPVTKKK
ncbi:MAG TPA: signal peptidase I [Bacteroidia bacterium]|jgi:signal peptidase I|nr:signal peptidase I [Bacteroidia bacterium]